MPRIKFTIITLFAEALRPYLESSMLYKAQERGIIVVEYVNLREFGLGPHKSVDDTPYGGGDGMLLRPEPVFAAIESIKAQDPAAEVIIPTPVGQVWNQALARKFAGIEDLDNINQNMVKAPETHREAREGTSQQNLGDTALILKNAVESEFEAVEGKSAAIEVPESAQNQAETSQNAENPVLAPNQSNAATFKHYIILCPHYEGYDERILSIVDHKISLGNYILTGGELPALIMIDSITRLLPGVLGGATSAEIESFSKGDNLEYPQYTKPAEFRGMKVPEILLSGHHGKVSEWRKEQTKRQSEIYGAE